MRQRVDEGRQHCSMPDAVSMIRLSKHRKYLQSIIISGSLCSLIDTGALKVIREKDTERPQDTGS